MGRTLLYLRLLQVLAVVEALDLTKIMPGVAVLVAVALTTVNRVVQEQPIKAMLVAIQLWVPVVEAVVLERSAPLDRGLLLVVMVV